ncbi:unnamed protein product [Parajaminaea phylloscopi]
MAATQGSAAVHPFSRPGTPHPQQQIGFVGLGNMGRSMAKNLAKNLAGRQPPLPPLLVYNRTAAKSHELQEECPKGTIKVAKSLEEVGSSCDLVLTSLSDDAAARKVFAELLAGEEKANGSPESRHSTAKLGVDVGPPGENKGRRTIFVDTSTLYPDTTGELERLVSSVPNRYFVAAPAFGPPPMAAAGTLVFAIAGPHVAKKFLVQFLVPGVGRKVMDFGSNPERAASFKLIGNSVILSLIEMLSESMTLAEKTGVGADRLYEFIEEFFPAPSAIGYGKKILTQNFKSSEGFTLSGGIKDASHIRRLGAAADCPLPIIDIAAQHLISARANAPHGEEELDWSSLVAGQRIAAGLPPFSQTHGLQRDGGRKDHE